ncbi:ribonuclease T [Archangium violaceum]|uniref:ribonuclease T2 family protein n=1 Tax=Archangium violaceum TaxID=83451 RepID=UPI002B309040|nr:ribonuclease T [Archangium violaceum]
MIIEWRKRHSSVLLAVSVFFAPGPSGASVPLRGTLHAERDCEAFVSKKKKSNPDKARLEPGDAYLILEVNRPQQPDWVRVRVEDANPPERWVEASCGRQELSETPAEEEQAETERPIEPDDPSLCSTAGLQDSFKLALSWQPAFCESHRGKKECAANFPAAYQSAGNFTLHGLWPNREACGINYGNCEHRRPQREFCDYPSPGVNAEVTKQLSQVMPGTASCLERHEWFKHGTCQVDWDPSQYFEVAIDLVRQFNDSGLNKFMAANMGKQVLVEDFLTQVDSALGEGTRQRLQLTCAGGKLTDVYISLPAHIQPGSSLSELIRTAPQDFRSKCSARFLVDPVGFGR